MNIKVTIQEKEKIYVFLNPKQISILNWTITIDNIEFKIPDTNTFEEIRKTFLEHHATENHSILITDH